MKTTETKEKITEQCFRLLLEKGYDGVSISDIQNATGMSRGLLYHYFGSKEELFREVTNRFFLDLFSYDLDHIAEYGIFDMTEHILERYRELLTKTLKGVSILSYDYLFYRVMQENAEFGQIYEKQRADEYRAWCVVVGNSQRRGEIRGDLSIENVALQYIYLSDGVWLRAVTPTSRIDLRESFAEAVQTLFSLIKN